MRQRRQKGFTLAEVLIVVAIIAVLAAVSIPVFTSKLQTARKNTCDYNRKAIERYSVYAAVEDDAYQTLIKGNPSSAELEAFFQPYFGEDLCPSKGTYTYAPAEDGIRTIVTCSQHGGGNGSGDNGGENGGGSTSAATSGYYQKAEEIYNSGVKKQEEIMDALDAAGIGNTITFEANSFYLRVNAKNMVGSGKTFYIYAGSNQSGSGLKYFYDSDHDQWYQYQKGTLNTADRSNSLSNILIQIQSGSTDWTPVTPMN